MAQSPRKSKNNIFVWAMLGLLAIALAGTGIGGFAGGTNRIGSVGDVVITTDDYARALQQELLALTRQTGQPITLADMIGQGLDQAILRNLVARAALTGETQALNMSLSDTQVAQQIRSIPAFQGLDGAFDATAYELELSQSGRTAAEFAQEIRDATARSFLQLAVAGGITANSELSETFVAYQGEQRDFSMLILTADDLATPLPNPTATDLQTYYEAQPERFTRPAAKQITYAWITPALIMDDVTVDETALRALYADRRDLYVQPERRLLERLIFLDMAEAQSAFDSIIAGETDFDALVAARGLTLDDIDMGDVARDDLPPATADAIFADNETDIIGPLDSALGPALFRINAVLEPNTITFDDARAELRTELAEDAARRMIADMREAIDDLLVGGATLEELGQDTNLALGTIAYSGTPLEDPIAAYDAFRAAADVVAEGDFPEIMELSDGGLFALRLDRIVPETLPPLAEIEDEVTAAWQATALREALTTQGESLIEAINQTTDLETLGEIAIERGIRRQDFIPDTPPTLVAQVFQLDTPGNAVLIPGADRAVIVRLDAVHPIARDAPDTTLLLEFAEQSIAQSMAQDVFEAYGQALERDAGIQLNRSAIDAVHARFP